MLNTSGGSGDTRTAPYLRGEAFSVSPLSLYSVVLFDFKYILSEYLSQLSLGTIYMEFLFPILLLSTCLYLFI